MDDLVVQAMAKWPNVPNCFGWLALDSRGQWWMRDDRAQAAGAFTSGVPAARGSLLTHTRLVEFIGRNYGCDDAGQWFFQNGPQRVYVELESAPWVWRIAPDLSVASHTGVAVEPGECLTDENGRVYLASARGLGLVHTQDVGLAADAIEAGRWLAPQMVAAEALCERYGFVRQPGGR